MLPIALWGPGAPASEEESRLRTVNFDPATVIALTGFVGYHIHFEFAPDERFVTLGAGDTAAFDVGAEANHLLLKPKVPTSGTNLTILTNRRTYFVDFRALNRAPHSGELVYSVTFHYPADVERASGARPVDDASAALAALPAPVNLNYWYCGDPAVRPTRVDDDGLHVRLVFAPRAELPAIYAAEPDGGESLVNLHVENDTVVVHRLSRRLVLRRGRLVGCVVNRSIDDTGRRGDSGTVQPAIERETAGAKP
jgi:type IV secretion system protein VirB9